MGRRAAIAAADTAPMPPPPVARPRPLPARLQRELDAARLEVAHLSASSRRLEGELEAAQKRVRCLTDDLEEAREPFVADQGE